MISFEVEGVSCDHCVTVITKAVHDLDPTARVLVDIPEQKVVINATDVPPQQFAEAITEAGYDIIDQQDQ